MRLYPKRLRNIEDLEREKKRLLKESKRMEEDGFLSLEGILSNKPGKDGGDPGLFDLLPTSNPLVAVVIKLVKNRLFNKDNNSKTSNAIPAAEEKPGKNRLKSIAVEFIGGYLKWKAIEFSYKGIRLLIKRRKEKRSADQ